MMKLSKLLSKKIKQYLLSSIVNNAIIVFNSLLNLRLWLKRLLNRKKIMSLLLSITKLTIKQLKLLKLKVSHLLFFSLMEFKCNMKDQELRIKFYNSLNQLLKVNLSQSHHWLKFQLHLLLFMIQLSHLHSRNYQLFSQDTQFIKLNKDKK